MDKWHKEVLKSKLGGESKLLYDLKRNYRNASKEIDGKIAQLMGRSDANMQHVVYQVQYQKALKKQIDGVLDSFKQNDFTMIDQYLQQSYEEGFVGTLYTLQKQGVPLIFPINQEQVVRSVLNNTKIKGGLYKKLGVNVDELKEAVRTEISRGISTASSYADIARNVNSKMNIGLNKSVRIARTESHRIDQEASYDAMKKAQDAGADIVKQWDSTLDKRTRPHHSALDGQVRELDQPFEVVGLTTMHPGGFGIADEDINCRCIVQEIGRWELDDDAGSSKMADGEIKDFSNAKDYDEFKKQYWGEAPKLSGTKPTEPARVVYAKNYDNSIGLNLGKELYDDMHQKVLDCPNPKLAKVWKTYEDQVKIASVNTPRAYCEVDAPHIHVSAKELKTGSALRDGTVWSQRNQVLFHESGHAIDGLAGKAAGLRGKKFSVGYKNGAFYHTLKSEVDDMVSAAAKRIKDGFEDHKRDWDWLLKNGLIDDFQYKLKGEWALPKKYSKELAYKSVQGRINALGWERKANLSDIFEGVTNSKVKCGAGHGQSYWNSWAINGINEGVSMEAFAEMLDATMAAPKQLEAIKEVLPNSYKFFEEMIDEIAKLT